MRREEFTSEHVLAVCRLYQHHLGGHGIEDYIGNEYGDLEELAEEIQEHGVTESYRIGSKYDFHTKLGFVTDRDTKDVVPDVNLNFDPKDRQGERYEEAERTVESFMREATAYLSRHSAG